MTNTNTNTTTVTVLFTDVVGNTALRRRLGNAAADLADPLRAKAVLAFVVAHGTACAQTPASSRLRGLPNSSRGLRFAYRRELQLKELAARRRVFEVGWD